MDLLHWGLIPFWAKAPDMGGRMINARAETAAEKPAYRAAFRQRRCLVPADAFYEWQKQEGSESKQPYCIRMKDESPFVFAGLWERWRPKHGSDDAHAVESFTILTTTPNALLKKVHDRMPVILRPEDYDHWLDPDLQDPEHIQKLLRPFPAEYMQAYPITRHVNNPGNDDPTCLAPAPGTDPAPGNDSGADLFPT